MTLTLCLRRGDQLDFRQSLHQPGFVLKVSELPVKELSLDVTDTDFIVNKFYSRLALKRAETN